MILTIKKKKNLFTSSISGEVLKQPHADHIAGENRTKEGTKPETDILAEKSKAVDSHINRMRWAHNKN